MGIFNGCLLACDIDGTLVSNELLPQRNIEKIRHFVRGGGAFSLSTGRTAAALNMITSKINCISPSVLCNGCVIYDFKSNKPLKEKCLPYDALGMASRVLAQGGIGIEIHSAGRIFVPARSASSDLHEEYELITPVFADLEVCLKEKINKIIYFAENERQAEFLAALSADYRDRCTFYNTCSFIGGVKQNYFEQLPTGVSKADALNSLCEMLNIKKGGFFAIGDYYNDVPMLKAADISAVPAESPDDVKAVADVVTGGVRGGAVADFIDYLEERLKDAKANKT